MYQITSSKKSLDELVKKAKFDWKYINPSITELPFFIQKKVDIEFLHFDQLITNQKLLKEVKNKGYRLASFREALELAIKFPDLQKQYFLATIEYIGKQLYDLYLYSDGGKRILNVNENNPDNYWFDFVRFLVVPAPVPAMSSRELVNSELNGPLETWPLEILTINGHEYMLVEK